MQIMVMAGLMGAGLFFFLVGTLGLLRLPDALTRAHGAAKCDTLGALLCILAVLMATGMNGAGLKLMLMVVFLWIANPTATHLLARGILKRAENPDKEERPC